jgi:hypothetical protein
MAKCIFPLFLLICIIFLDIACNQCELALESHLTDQQKNQNPFKGFEKIIYKTADSTVELTGTGRKNWVEQFSISQFSCDWGERELDEMKFVSNSYEIRYRMSGRNELDWFFNDNTNEIHLQSVFYIENDPSKNSGYDEFIDSLYVDGGLFLNIYKDHLFSPYDFPDSLNHAVNLYYSIEYGIVKFDFSDGSTWELKEIVW